VPRACASLIRRWPLGTAALPYCRLARKFGGNPACLHASSGEREMRSRRVSIRSLEHRQQIGAHRSRRELGGRGLQDCAVRLE
jgi:hypothetical protein